MDCYAVAVCLYLAFLIKLLQTLEMKVKRRVAFISGTMQ